MIPDSSTECLSENAMEQFKNLPDFIKLLNLRDSVVVNPRKLTYTIQQFDKSDFHCLMDKDEKAWGLVRSVSASGGLEEFQVSDGVKHGFYREIEADGAYHFGYFNKGSHCGKW